MDTETTETTQTEEQAPVETNSELELQAAEAALAVMPDDDGAGKEETRDVKTDRLISKRTAISASIRAKVARDAELDAAIATKEANLAAGPEVKGPMDVFAAEHPDEVPTANVHLADRKFQEAKQATAQQAKAKTDAAVALSARAQDTLERGQEKFSDFQEMHEAAGDLLTKGDWLDIREAEFPEDELYERSMGAIRKAGTRPGATAEAKETWNTLATRLRAKKVATESVKKKAPTEDGSEEVTVRTERTVHLQRLQEVLG